LLVSIAQLHISLLLLQPLSLPHDNQVCTPTPNLSVCYFQTYSGDLPLFGSLYDGDYPLPPAQGFPDWCFSYRDRTSHGATSPGSCSELSEHALNGATPSSFTFSPDPSPAQADRSEACHDKPY